MCDDFDSSLFAFFTLVRRAQDNPRAVLEAGGAKACLAFFDFFPMDLQQNALGTVSRLVAPGVCGRKSDIKCAREVHSRVNPIRPLENLFCCTVQRNSGTVVRYTLQVRVHYRGCTVDFGLLRVVSN